MSATGVRHSGGGAKGGLQIPRQCPVIRPIGGVTALVSPDDLPVPDQVDSRHLAHVSMRAAGAMSLEEDLHGAPPDPGVQQLPQAVEAQAEVCVKMKFCVGDCPSLRPEAVEEVAAGLRWPLDEKQDAGEIGIPRRQPPQFLNLLAAERSPEVAQESQQGRPAGNLIRQGARYQVHTGDRSV